MFGPIHCRVDAMFGSFEQNESYCSKEMDGKLIKFGKEPNQGESMVKKFAQLAEHHIIRCLYTLRTQGVGKLRI